MKKYSFFYIGFLIICFSINYLFGQNYFDFPIDLSNQSTFGYSAYNNTGWCPNNPSQNYFLDYNVPYVAGQTVCYSIQSGDPVRQHAGCDFFSDYDDDILSMGFGYVVRIENLNTNDHGMGTNVIIKHYLNNGNSIYASYFHLNNVDVSLYDFVSTGEKIGTLGASGYGISNFWCSGTCSQSHLHLETKEVLNNTHPTGSTLPCTSPSSSGFCFGNVPGYHNPDIYGYTDPLDLINEPNNPNNLYELHKNPKPQITCGFINYNSPIPIAWQTLGMPHLTGLRVQIFKGFNPSFDPVNGYGVGVNSQLVVNKAFPVNDPTNAQNNLSNRLTGWDWQDQISNSTADGIYENPLENKAYYAILKAEYEIEPGIYVTQWSVPILFTTDPNFQYCGSVNLNQDQYEEKSVSNCTPDVYLTNQTVSNNNTNPGSNITISADQHLDDYSNGNVNVKMKYWFSSDINLDTNDTYIGSDISSIGNTPYNSESILYTIPNVSDGTYYVLIEADSDNIIPNELSEVNNIVGIPLVVSNPNNQINLTLTQNNLTGTAGESKIISGFGNYTNGNQVFVGTVTITTSNQTYTASLFNGSFSKLINLPASSGTILVHLTDGTLTDIETIPVSITNGSNGNGYDVLNYTTCISNNNNTMPCEFFSDRIKTYEDLLFLWIELENNTGPTQARWKIYKPDGTLYDSHSSNIYNLPSTYFYYGLSIAGTNVADINGEWTVEYYARVANGTPFDYIGSKTFVLSHILTEQKMCKGVSNGSPVNVTNTFCNSDSHVYSWANFSDYCNPINTKIEWFEPNGSFFDDYTYALPDPGPAPQDWVPNYPQWMYYDISNSPMRDKTGVWEIKYYTQSPSGNWRLEYSDNFEIIECPNINPTITAASNAPRLEGQNVNIDINAFDNGYINNVVLYYNTGNGWLTNSYNNIMDNTYVLNNISLGTFNEGDVIHYYAEATDNSGNVGGSGIQTIIIGDSDTNGPLISNVLITEDTGNNDSYFQDNEILKFQASVTDPSGIATVQYYIDGNAVTLNGNYFTVEGPYIPGDHTLTIISYDDDISQAISTHEEVFHICDNVYYIDTDGDGFGAGLVYECLLMNNYSLIGGDCDDANPAVTELTTWYADNDGDGYGDINEIVFECYVPNGYVPNSSDCNDTNSNIHPNAIEICDGVDNNCNNQIDETGCCVTNLNCNNPITNTGYYQGFENGLNGFI